VTALSDYGVHRVIEPAGALPQAARVLDPSLPMRDNELLINVERLNIDSASFHQIMGEVGRNGPSVANRIVGIVRERGKMQNPVTGSGGMLLGTVAEVGRDYRAPARGIELGARVATLVSLTLTPLVIERVREVHLDADQVEIDGYAILWSSSPIVALPSDLDDRLALAVLDVCGAPAQVARLAAPHKNVAIIGAGKSGVLCMAQARRTMGQTGRIVAVDRNDATLKAAAAAGIIDGWAVVDARDPVAASRAITDELGGPADLVINVANVDQTEMTAILAVADGGTVYFFNMATSFSRAALGAEGVGRDANLIIGNGYAHGHAELALELVRSDRFVRQYFEAVLARSSA
jgi:L-erythro-3,5-diaminohexanoate dehydrogenase